METDRLDRRVEECATSTSTDVVATQNGVYKIESINMGEKGRNG